jgi:RNA polymerase sigma-70 factor (ECF subfamily)
MARSTAVGEEQYDEKARKLIERSLKRDPTATRQLVSIMTPVVHARVARALVRQQNQARGRALRQDAEDLVQEVFAALFARGGKALRAWDSERGLSFRNFVGFLAEREVVSILRCGKRNPWTEDPTLDDKLVVLSGKGPSHELQVASRELLETLSERLRERLSPLGWRYFKLLYVEERPVKEVAVSTGASEDALYAWRSRLGRLIRQLQTEILAEDEGGSHG